MSSKRSFSTPLRQPLSACCSDCCQDEGESASASYFTHFDNTTKFADHSRARELSSNVDRQWVSVTAYQPIDLVTKTIEVPIVKKIQKRVPKIQIEEKIIHVPKVIPQYVEKIVEVPQVKIVEKIVEIPQVHYNTQYIKKVEIQEKIIYNPKPVEKIVEKKVEIPIVQEVVRYKEIIVPEEIIKYIPENTEDVPWDEIYANYLNQQIDNKSENKKNNQFINFNENQHQNYLNLDNFNNNFNNQHFTHTNQMSDSSKPINIPRYVPLRNREKMKRFQIIANDFKDTRAWKATDNSTNSNYKNGLDKLDEYSKMLIREGRQEAPKIGGCPFLNKLQEDEKLRIYEITKDPRKRPSFIEWHSKLINNNNNNNNTKNI